MTADDEAMAGSPHFLPSQHQRLLWWRFVMSADGTDDDGNWLGWCPLHDEVFDMEVPSALFNFKAGVLKCQGEPSCHEGKRAMSLSNVMIKQLAGKARERGAW